MPEFIAEMPEQRNVENEKLATAALYLLRGCSTSRPGKVSLLKMLWYADYWHYREHLTPITGAAYVALPDGPVIDNYRDVFASLERNGYVERHEIPIQGKDYPKQEFHPLMEPDDEVFSETEIEILDRVIDELGGHSGGKLSKMTHKEPPWLQTWDADRPGRDIPYGLFRWMDNLPDEEDLRHANEIIEGRPELQEEIRRLNRES